jgi:hypothetical protein
MNDYYQQMGQIHWPDIDSFVIVIGMGRGSAKQYIEAFFFQTNIVCVDILHRTP